MPVSDWPRIARGGLLPAALRFACATAALLAGCTDDTAPAGTTTEILGDAVPVGHGTARAVLVTNASRPQSIGVELSAEAVDGLPDTEAEFALPLPAETSVPPWDHVAIDWNPHGHPPDAYMLPHFDFHFYDISASQQAAIGGGEDMVPVPAENVPQD
jgi:hypothetical protein